MPEASFYCPSVNNIAAFDNRIHLRCSQANGGVTYYAYPNDIEHATVANQILAIASSALLHWILIASALFVLSAMKSGSPPPLQARPRASNAVYTNPPLGVVCCASDSMQDPITLKTTRAQA